jgi:beta-phosphoglucomutase-like phosphatase (HAD superfamily)
MLRSRSTMLHAIVFDFDGVLANSEPLHFEAFRRVLAGQAVTLDEAEYYAKYLGYDDAGAFRHVLGDRGRRTDEGLIAALVAEKLAAFPDILNGQHVLFPGAADCVRRFAAHVPLAIASGALSQDIDLVLAGTGLRESFLVVVGAEQTPQSKPHPDPYLRAVRLLQERGAIPPGDVAGGCVAIEDSRWGIRSAKTAGLRCIAVTTSYAAHELDEADLVVGSLNEVSLEGVTRLVTST